jgi:hypothetical protein
MAKRSDGGKRPAITAKDVFDRSNMPSRWERLTGVGPKIPEDRKFLNFVAARYCGEPRLPHPDTLAAPVEMARRETVGLFGRWTFMTGGAVLVLGLVVQLAALATIGVVFLIVALTVVVIAANSTAPAIAEFQAWKSRCEAAHARVSEDALDPEYASTLNAMICHDEGTLAYCAAKIASEIEREPAWKAACLELIAVDLWDELDEIGSSAKQIADDREATEALILSRLHKDPEVREMIDTDNRQRHEALALLTARVYAFADYRDRVHRLGMSALRNSRTASRAMKQAADELAVAKLR